MTNTITILPILVAAIAAFVIGAIWYSPFLFGKEWMSLLKITEADIAATKAKGGMWKSYLAQIIVTLISFAVLGFVLSNIDGATTGNGAFFGLLLWLGFTIPMNASDLLWKNQSFKLVAIDAVQRLLALVIGGAIIGGWN